ncbi:MAG: hypothetical protein P4L55_11955 [Syntrophobacteraceae bacterium]|nr:hypothetical protein [Syntrophobacteraceae bacterium]
MIFAIILSFFGLTLMYTGFLASAHHMTTGIVATCAGLLLLAKPTLEAVKLFKTQFGGPSSPLPRSGHRKNGEKTVYLKIVKSEDEKPTIH